MTKAFQPRRLTDENDLPHSETHRSGTLELLLDEESGQSPALFAKLAQLFAIGIARRNRIDFTLRRDCQRRMVER